MPCFRQLTPHCDFFVYVAIAASGGKWRQEALTCNPAPTNFLPDVPSLAHEKIPQPDE
jgi:hypothetical protein